MLRLTGTITDGAGAVIAESDTTISFYNEQIIPGLGLSVAVQQAPTPGGDDEERLYNNGVITSEIVYDDPSKEWWSGIKDDKSYTPYNWILAGTTASQQRSLQHIIQIKMVMLKDTLKTS